MGTSADLISFDAYDYIESFASPADDLARFVDGVAFSFGESFRPAGRPVVSR